MLLRSKYSVKRLTPQLASPSVTAATTIIHFAFRFKPAILSLNRKSPERRFTGSRLSDSKRLLLNDRDRSPGHGPSSPCTAAALAAASPRIIAICINYKIHRKWLTVGIGSGARGCDLSGAESRRIAIRRALLIAGRIAMICVDYGESADP